MQLLSPGTLVTIIDESIYAGTGPGTVPLIILATAENKLVPDGSAIAEATLPENANRVYLASSQRELIQLFGEPKFGSVGSQTFNGSPLNEYGLLAAHSYLGISNSVYLLRADIDLDELKPTTFAPTACKPEGTYWLNPNDSDYGLNILVIDPNDEDSVVWQKVPMDYVFIGQPDDDVGQDGEYSVSIYTSAAVKRIEYYIYDTDEWVLLAGYNSPGSPIKLIASAVYPSFDQQGNALTTADEETAYWINTALQSGIDLDMKQSVVSCEYTTVDIPSFAYDFTDAISAKKVDDKATAYYNGAPSVGDLYVRTYALAAMNGDLSPNPYVAPDMSGVGNSTVGPNPLLNTVGISYSEVFYFDGAKWVSYSAYEVSDTIPVTGPVDGRLWFNPEIGLDAVGNSSVDLLINNGLGSWVNIEVPGYIPAGTTASETFYMQPLNPKDQLPAPNLQNGDIWLDSADVDNYPALYVWKTNKWIKIDNTNQTTPSGILFADARPAPDYKYGNSSAGINNGGGSNPDLDMGVPDPDAYPKGMLLWNTRFSANNVKQWRDSVQIHVVDNAPVFAGRWVSVSGNKSNGALIAGEAAQRKVIATKLQGVIASNEEIRAEFINYNLIATPGFTECIDEMVSLNVDRKQTAFVIGDSPFTLKPTSNDLRKWATNANGATENGVDGLLTSDIYLGVYYPSCATTTNLDGTTVVVPFSHCALRSYAYNDQVAYQWFAPAGDARGKVNNANAVGYVNDEGQFVSVALNEGLRDVLYTNRINPVAQFLGQSPTIYGQKTRSDVASALDRINVARLTNYLRFQLDIIVRPFLFEPNDAATRSNVQDLVERFLSELVTLRGISDFLVVVDESNNTPIRIDRNELWIDVFVIPVKAIEAIYVPVRIRNTAGI